MINKCLKKRGRFVLKSGSKPFEFTEWTPDGHLETFEVCWVSEDKEVREVVREG